MLRFDVAVKWNGHRDGGHYGNWVISLPIAWFPHLEKTVHRERNVAL